MTFAIKSGISIASSYAIKTVATFVTKIPEADATRLQKLRKKLETRMEIVSSAIDLIKLVAAKGNTNLGSTLRLTRDLKEEIDQFDVKITEITSNFQAKKNQRDSIAAVENYISGLLSRIEEVIPLINLSLTTSGAKLSTALPQYVSPGRLLQASNYITKNNELANKLKETQVGPTFELTMFSVFYNIASVEAKSRVLWKEDMRKALVTVWRKSIGDREYDYFIRLKESFNDGRYHDPEEETPKLKERDIWQITKLFFTASGKLLKLEERNSPVLVLKVDKDIKSPFAEDHGTSTEDVEWLAFGECDFEADLEESSESEAEDEGDDESNYEETTESPVPVSDSIALLEYIIRLASLQCNDQLSILQVHDERLSMYLNDENPNSIKSKRYNVDEVTTKLKKIDLDQK